MHRPNAIALCCLLLTAWSAHAARSERGVARFMEVPMLGAVGPDHILIWTRASGRFPVSVAYGTDPALANARRTDPVTPAPENDFACVIRIDGLEPGTTYHYQALLDGKPDAYDRAPVSTFKTAPAPGARTRFSMATGSCARQQRDRAQPIWNVVRDLQPGFFVWTGDNIYGDSLEPSTLAEEYRRQRSVESLEPVLRTVPQLAIWDDHDFGLNDHDRTNPVKDDALRVFKRYWANPAYGLPDAPGVFFSWSYGGVDFFFLDGRYYRDPNSEPDSPTKTFLGERQLAWLQDGLKKSAAPFKVLVCGSGWTNAKGAGGDSWAACLQERDSLFEFIRVNEVSGVVLVSGDTHTGELNAIPWSDKGGYDFYDLVSSPLAQKGSTGWRERSPEVRLRPGVEEPNVGLIEFDLTGTPTLTYTIYTADGRTAWRPLTITADELRNGIASARSRVDMTGE